MPCEPSNSSSRAMTRSIGMRGGSGRRPTCTITRWTQGAVDVQRIEGEFPGPRTDLVVETGVRSMLRVPGQGVVTIDHGLLTWLSSFEARPHRTPGRSLLPAAIGRGRDWCGGDRFRGEGGSMAAGLALVWVASRVRRIGARPARQP